MNQFDPIRLLIIGGGPAGTQAAMTAASLGAEVTLVEKDIVGGAAHLLDCIPSKTMVSSAVRIQAMRDAENLGVQSADRKVDLTVLAGKMEEISRDISEGHIDVLESQGVRIIDGFGRFTGPHSAVAVVDGEKIALEFDVGMVSTGSYPRVPEWATVNGSTILTTRDAYSLEAIPEHIIVVGSGVTGVEFVNVFEALGAKVTLVVSRQQVLPHSDPEVAVVLEQNFMERGVTLLKGARAEGISQSGDVLTVHVDDGRKVTGSHVLLAIGSVPLTGGVGLEAAGIELDHGYVPVDELNRTVVPHIYAAGDICGKMPLSSVAAMQGRKIAMDAMGRRVTPIDYTKVAQAIFTVPEIASVGLDEAILAAAGRRIRSTKVPFAANSRAVIQGNTDGFVKVISDPATNEVLGGTIVGQRASELIGMLALAVQGSLHVDTLLETIMVYPSLSESLTEASH
jgi:pyruvate/2-oxoglutarate dehydrogenase complex dihydrolipoamide dehydrogenase (E3) component